MATKIICTQDETFIVGSGGRQQEINQRIDHLKKQIQQHENHSPTQISMLKVKIEISKVNSTRKELPD